MSQKLNLAKFLATKNSVTNLQAAKKWRVKNLRARISELRVDGWKFETEVSPEKTTYSVVKRPKNILVY